jgi:hypothetical protein
MGKKDQKVSAVEQPQYTDPIVRARLGLKPLAN